MIAVTLLLQNVLNKDEFDSSNVYIISLRIEKNPSFVWEGLVRFSG